MTIAFYITISVLCITLLPILHLCFLFTLFIIPKMVEGMYRLALFLYQHIDTIVLYIYIGYVVFQVLYILFFHCFYNSMDEFGIGLIGF